MVHISVWISWKSALPICKHSLLPTLTYSGPFWSDYHQRWEHHLPFHLGSSNERLHRLAEDVKLSAHRRHPTVYPFISYCFYFTFIFIVFLFFFPVLLVCFIFKDKIKDTSVQAWGCAMNHASLDSSPKPRLVRSM
jgi:hypothetical protein